MLKDKCHDKDTKKKELTDNVASIQSPKPITYSSRKRSAGDLCPQGFITDRHMPVRRNRRSSSRVQNIMFPCNDGGKKFWQPINQCNLDFLDADENKIQMQKMQVRIKK